jgi:hypothetical protein
MPRPSDDDAPRWELPVWEPPADSPTADVSRWGPERDIPRWQPRRGPATARVDRRAMPTAGVSPPKSPPVVRPFAWWGSHPWMVVWVGVLLAPAAVVLLRALDESGLEMLVQPLTWVFAALFVVVLAFAMLTSARRSGRGLALGTIGALVALATLLWPVTRVTLGRTACPARAGADLGAPVARAALDAWLRGDQGDDGWRNAQADGAWRDRSRAVTLLDYRLVETGCWERAAPIDATHTWHQFRVTIRDEAQTALLKSVVIHTALVPAGWTITAIEGPLP